MILYVVFFCKYFMYVLTEWVLSLEYNVVYFLCYSLSYDCKNFYFPFY